MTDPVVGNRSKSLVSKLNNQGFKEGLRIANRLHATDLHVSGINSFLDVGFFCEFCEVRKPEAGARLGCLLPGELVFNLTFQLDFEGEGLSVAFGFALPIAEYPVMVFVPDTSDVDHHLALLAVDGALYFTFED